MASQNINVTLRLLNGRRFQTAMYQSAQSVRGAKMAMQEASNAGSELGRAGYAAEAGLYAVGAASRFAMYAAGALSATWVGLGIQFNATMEGNALALEHFAGGAEKAKAMTKDLFDIASRTPFSFEDITTAARRFLAFGFSVKETTGLLKTMGDTLSFTGGSTDEILRFAKAIGDIRSKGRLMQQEMNQLTNLNLPIQDILKAGGLELTEKQMKNVGRAGIKAEEAIAAIKLGLDKTFGGGSEKYLNTFNGQWQRLVDNIKMAAGESTTGIFGWLKEGLTFINDQLENNGPAIASKLKGYIEGGVKLIGVVFLFLKERFNEFMEAIKPMAPFFENVLLPTLKGIAIGIIATLVIAWKILIGVIEQVAPVLGDIGNQLAGMKPFFELVGQAIVFVFGGALVKAAGWLMKFGGALGLIGRVVWLAVLPLRLIIGVMKFVGRTFEAVRKGGLTQIYVWFDDFVKFLGTLPSKMLGLGKRIGKGLLMGIVGMFASAGDFAGDIGRKIADWLNDNTPFGDKINLGVTSFRIPALATGGDIIGGGYALVGDAGPEVVKLPPGASVIPNRAATVRRPNEDSKMSRGAVFENQGFGDQTINLVVDGRVLAEVVAGRVNRSRARG